MLSMKRFDVPNIMYDIQYPIDDINVRWKTYKYMWENKKPLMGNLNLVGPRGFEPLTSTTSMWRSSQNELRALSCY